MIGYKQALKSEWSDSSFPFKSNFIVVKFEFLDRLKIWNCADRLLYFHNGNVAICLRHTSVFDKRGGFHLLLTFEVIDDSTSSRQLVVALSLPSFSTNTHCCPIRMTKFEGTFTNFKNEKLDEFYSAIGKLI